LFLYHLTPKLRFSIFVLDRLNWPDSLKLLGFSELLTIFDFDG